MSFLAGLYDPVEERLYEADPGRYVAGSNSPRGLSAVYDYEALRESVESFGFLADGSTLSRFLPLLPLEEGISIPSADLGSTPVVERSAANDDDRPSSVRVKDEGDQPGGTIWDRGAAVALSVAREWSRGGVIYPSDDPISRSVDRYASRANLTRYVLREDPDRTLDASFEGITGIRWSSGRSLSSSRKVLELSRKYDLFPVLPGWNPYFVEGLKTVAYELAEQFDPLPGVLYASAHSRLVVHAVTKGFRELATVGWFEDVPEVVRVVVPGGRDEEPGVVKEEFPEELAPDQPRVRERRPTPEQVGNVNDSLPRSVRAAVAASERDERHEPPESGVAVLRTGDFVELERTVDPETIELDGPLESLPDDHVGSA